MPYSIAPLRVTKLLQETHVYSFSDELRACFGTAQQIAADSNYELKVRKCNFTDDTGRVVQIASRAVSFLRFIYKLDKGRGKFAA